MSKPITQAEARRIRSQNKALLRVIESLKHGWYEDVGAPVLMTIPLSDVGKAIAKTAETLGYRFVASVDYNRDVKIHGVKK